MICVHNPAPQQNWHLMIMDYSQSGWFLCNGRAKRSSLIDG
jgi:hypothetical protein